MLQRSITRTRTNYWKWGSLRKRRSWKAWVYSVPLFLRWKRISFDGAKTRLEV